MFLTTIEYTFGVLHNYYNRNGKRNTIKKMPAVIMTFSLAFNVLALLNIIFLIIDMIDLFYTIYPIVGVIIGFAVFFCFNSNKMKSKILANIQKYSIEEAKRFEKLAKIYLIVSLLLFIIVQFGSMKYFNVF
jgi:hypothetical protein